MNEDVFHLGVKALIRNKQGDVLLLQVNPAKLHGERKEYWDLPGGRVQKGDSIEDTLKREVLEETGITEVTGVRPVTMVLSNIRIPVGDGDSVGLVLSIHSCAIPDNASITLSDEHIAYEWFAPSAASELLRIKYPKEFCEAVAALR